MCILKDHEGFTEKADVLIHKAHEDIFAMTSKPLTKPVSLSSNLELTQVKNY